MELGYSFIDRLQEIDSVDEIILFGSRATGTFHDRSDIDLAIWCPNASDRDWNDVLECVENADTLLKIDCVRLDKMSEDNPLRRQVESNGQIIFRR